MTADYCPFDHAFLGRVANRIINEVRGISRVTYDITSKPPGTIEWSEHHTLKIRPTVLTIMSGAELRLSFCRAD